VTDRLISTAPTSSSVAPVEAIDVIYPTRTFSILGFEAPWIVAFFLFTLGLTLLLRPLFRVAL
jgi:hypothetical protein